MENKDFKKMTKDYIEEKLEKSIDFVCDVLNLGNKLNYGEMVILSQVLLLKDCKSKKELKYILKLINEDLEDYCNSDLNIK